MTDKKDRLAGQVPLQFTDTEPPTNAQLAWNEESGRAVSDLALMLRKPTAERPFVYDIRFDLLSTGNSVSRVILKGFGEDGSLIAFHDAVGLLDGLRGLEGRFRAGKVKWHPDTYPPKTYDQKLALYLSGSVYSLT